MGYLWIGLELRGELAFPPVRFQSGDRKPADDVDPILELGCLLPEDFDLDLCACGDLAHFLRGDLDHHLRGDLDPFLPEDFDLDLFLRGDRDSCGSEVLLGKGGAEVDGAGPPWLVAWRLGLELWNWEEEGTVEVVGGCWDSSGAELKEEDEENMQ